MTRALGFFALATTLAACGGGTMTGTVTVRGGSAANIAVFVYGPVSTAAVTNAEGRFSASGLPDGDYSVVAKLRGADVEEQAVAVKMTGGKPDPEPTLAFVLSTGTVTGTLVFADGSDASNTSVTLTGAGARGTRTGAGGSFTFEKVPAGAWVVSVDLVDTREKRASVGVAVTGGTHDVGEIRMTTVGRVGGTVTFNGAPAGNVQVAVAGTALAAVTDALGRFDFAEVPTGDATFVATSGAQRQYSATASARVNRGANPDLALALGDDQGRRGTVTGSVTFVGPQSPALITVSVAGAAVTATPSQSGAFSLMVPEGDWDVVATAPFHPRQVIGRARVLAGQTTALPAAELSWYREVWATDATLNAIGALASSPNTPWTVLRSSENTGTRSLLFNIKTGDLRVLASTQVSSPRFSENAKYLSFTLSGVLFLYEIATGAMTSWGTGVSTWDISTDETVLFAFRSGGLERITLATGAARRFPATGNATAVLEHTRDRWLVREASNSVTLVEPTTDTAALFTNVSSLSTYPTPWATTDCTMTCTLRVVAPTARSANAVSISVPAGGPSVLASPGDWPSFDIGGQYVIVQASNANATTLPTGTNTLLFNVESDRYAFRTVVAGTTSIREERLPPTANPNLVGQSNFGFSLGYVSATRLVAVEQGGTRRIIDYKGNTGSGTVTIETDVDASNPPILIPPLVSWSKTSSMKWHAFIGDKGTLALDVPASESVLTVSARSLFPGEAPTDYGAISFNTAEAWVLDEKLAQVRRLPGGYGAGADRSGTTEYLIWQRPGAADFVTFGPEVALALQHPALTFTTGLVAGGERASLGITNDRQHLWMGVIRP